MTSNTKYIVGGVVVVAILGLLFFLPMKGASRFGGTTNLDYLSLSSGMDTAGSINSAGAVNASSTSYFQQGLIEGGISSIATTSNAYTLAASNIVNVSLLSIVGSSSAATTVTFPGTTTLSTLVPNIGDTTLLVIYDATTTGSKLTLAGTPASAVELYSASTTKDVTANRSAFLRIFRAASSSIEIFMTSN